MSAEPYTIFDLQTRVPVSCVTCSKEALAERVRDGQIAIKGRHRGSVRLSDDNEPVPDDADLENSARDQRRNARQARIEELERKQARRVRELLAESDPQLKAIDDEIAALRLQLSDGPRLG